MKPVAPVMKVIGEDMVRAVCCSVGEELIWDDERVRGKICVGVVMRISTG